MGNTDSIDLNFVPNPCPNAILDSYFLNDMTADVFSSVTQAIPVVGSDVEAANPGLDCGPRSYKIYSNDTPIIDFSPFLSVVTTPSNDILLSPTQMSEINSSPGYSIKFTVSLVDYVGVFKSEGFTVFVTDPCPGTTLQNTGVADMFYTADDGTATS